MLVIIVAVIAIVAATVIMVMPQDSKKANGKLPAPPAPERMDVNPMPDKQSQLDPWGGGGAPGSVPRTPDPVPMPQPPAVDPDDDLWGGGGGGAGGGLSGANAANVQLNALVHACAKLKSCPGLDQSDFASVCDAVAMMPKPSPVTGCPAAQRCFDAIDRLDCSDASQASPHSVFTLFADCAQAANKC